MILLDRKKAEGIDLEFIEIKQLNLPKKHKMICKMFQICICPQINKIDILVKIKMMEKWKPIEF